MHALTALTESFVLGRSLCVCVVSPAALVFEASARGARWCRPHVCRTDARSWAARPRVRKLNVIAVVAFGLQAPIVGGSHATVQALEPLASPLCHLAALVGVTTRRTRQRPDSAHPGQHAVERPAFRAVCRFTTATVGRSQLHQGVLLGLSACGVGLAMNRLVGAGLVGRVGIGEPPSQSLISAAIWTPLVLMFVCGLSVRAALALPMEHRANWIFRLTEDKKTRREQMRAVNRVVAAYVAGVPVLVAVPILWRIDRRRSGETTWPSSPRVRACGVIDWRASVTCSTCRQISSLTHWCLG